MKIMINIRKKYSKEIDTKEEIVIKNQRLRVLFNKLDETIVEENELNKKLKTSKISIKLVYGALLIYFVIQSGIYINVNYDIKIFLNILSLAATLYVSLQALDINIQINNYTAIQQVKNNRNNLQNQIYNMAFNLYINDDLSTENRLNFEQNILNNSEFKKKQGVIL